MMYNRHPIAYYRKDEGGLTGEERVWGGELLPGTEDYGLFDQPNNALKPSWAPFRCGYFERRPTGTSGDSAYGFGPANGQEFWSIAHTSVIVNPLLMTTIPLQVAGGIAAILDSLIGWNNIGDTTSYIPVQSNGVLNQVGKDYIAFLFVRDPSTKNIT